MGILELIWLLLRRSLVIAFTTHQSRAGCINWKTQTSDIDPACIKTKQYKPFSGVSIAEHFCCSRLIKTIISSNKHMQESKHPVLNEHGNIIAQRKLRVLFLDLSKSDSALISCDKVFFFFFFTFFLSSTCKSLREVKLEKFPNCS